MVEVELKVLLSSDESAQGFLAAIASAAEASALRLVEIPPCTESDVYFDDDRLSLLGLGASLRLRRRNTRWKKRKKYDANFKRPSGGGPLLVREEEKSRVAPEDLDDLRDGIASIPAFEAARDFAGIDRSEELRPVLRVTSRRAVFLVGPPRLADGWHVLTVVVEDVEAARVEPDEDEALVDWGLTEWRPDRPAVTLRSGEVEESGHYFGRDEEGRRLLDDIVVRLKLDGYEAVPQTKYELCAARLGLVAPVGA